MKKIHWGVVLAGVAVGLAALILTAMGNPANMGFCIACFLRDTAGACGLHSAAKVQYVRPEIIGLVLGAFLMSVAGKEFKARAGSSPALRFVIGAFVVIGALAFLGCPLRMVLRLGGGDLNALVGLIGFFIGILIGIACLKRGFTLKRSYEVSVSEGSVLPTVMAALLILVLTVPALFKASEAGPGSMHAPFWIALIVALVVGALAQKSRLCMVGGLRDAVMLGDFHLLYGFAAIFVVTLVGNLAMNKFNLGFALAAHRPQRPRLEPAGHGARRLGQRAARRLPAASAHPGGAGQRRQRRDRVRHDRRRGSRAQLRPRRQPRQQERGRSARGRRHLHCGQGRRDRRPGRAAGDRPVEYAQKGGGKMIDARGYSCPMPVVMVQNEVKKNAPDTLEVLVDSQTCVENVTRFGEKQGYTVSCASEGGDFRLTLRK